MLIPGGKFMSYVVMAAVSAVFGVLCFVGRGVYHSFLLSTVGFGLSEEQFTDLIQKVNSMEVSVGGLAYHDTIMTALYWVGIFFFSLAGVIVLMGLASFFIPHLQQIFTFDRLKKPKKKPNPEQQKDLEWGGWNASNILPANATDAQKLTYLVNKLARAKDTEKPAVLKELGAHLDVMMTTTITYAKDVIKQSNALLRKANSVISQRNIVLQAIKAVKEGNLDDLLLTSGILSNNDPVMAELLLRDDVLNTQKDNVIKGLVLEVGVLTTAAKDLAILSEDYLEHVFRAQSEVAGLIVKLAAVGAPQNLLQLNRHLEIISNELAIVHSIVPETKPRQLPFSHWGGVVQKFLAGGDNANTPLSLSDLEGQLKALPVGDSFIIDQTQEAIYERATTK